MDFPEIFKGTPTPAKWAALGEYLRNSGTTGGPGLRVRRVGNKTVITTRRRTYGIGGEAGTLNPWQATFVTEADVLKVSFRLGTCNNVVPGNWNAKHTAPTGTAVKFVVLTVTSSGGKVTGATLSLDASAPAADEVAKDTPPTSHKIVLGAVGEGVAHMIVASNIGITASEVFRETSAAGADRAEPFHRWYRWQNSSAAT